MSRLKRPKPGALREGFGNEGGVGSAGTGDLPTLPARTANRRGLSSISVGIVDAKPKRTQALHRLSNISQNPAVALLVDHYDDANWDALWWVRADGKGRILDPNEPEASRAIALLKARYPQQQSTGQVLAVDVERWSGWTARTPRD